MAKQTIPRIEWTRFFPSIENTDGPLDELQAEPPTLKAVQDAGCATLSAVRALLATPQGTAGPEGLGARRRQELALALAVRDSKAATAASDEHGKRIAQYASDAMKIVSHRFGQEAEYHSMDVVKHEPSGRLILRIRWGCLSSWQGLLKQCRKEDPHFHPAPRRFAGKPEQPVEVIDD